MRATFLRRLAVLLAASAIAAGCSSDADDGLATETTLGTATTAQAAASEISSTCDAARRTMALRERHDPATGRFEQDLAVIASRPGSADLTECIVIRDDDGRARVDVTTRREPTDEQTLAIVVDPGRDGDDLAAAIDTVAAVIAAAPEASRIGLYALGPARDALTGSLTLIDPTALSWRATGDTGALSPDWRTARFDFSSDLWANATMPLVAAEHSDDGNGNATVAARTSLELTDHDPAMTAHLDVSHRGGLIAHVNGVEVIRSNTTLEADPFAVQATPSAGTTQRSTTVAAELLSPGTNVVSVTLHDGTSESAALEAMELVATVPRTVGVGAVGPYDAPMRIDLAPLQRLLPTALAPGDLDAALDVVVDQIELVERDRESPVRSVIVVAPALAPTPLELPGRVNAAVVWMGDGDGQTAGIDLAVDADTDPAEVHRWLAGIADDRYVVTGCARDSPIDLQLHVGVTKTETTVRERPPESAGRSCEPDPAPFEAEGAVDRVSIELAPDQRAVFDDAARRGERPDVSATIRFDDGAATPAAIRFRGQSTIDCDRKSLSINLDGATPRPIFEGAPTDELLALSLCLDRGYVRTATILELLHDAGLAPMRTRLVTLDLDGEPAGLYLLTEKPAEATADAQPGLHTVVRRALDTSFQISAVDAAPSQRGDLGLADYESWLAEAETSEDPVEAIAHNLDVDAYLRWLALMTVLGNGDYVDEVFFAATPTLDAGAAVALRWHPIAWDPDDIYSPCHFDDFSFDDPHGIAYCAEGRLDHAILGSDTGYAAFVDHVGATLDAVSVEDLGNRLETTRARIAELVTGPHVAAMRVDAAQPGSRPSTVGGLLEAIDAEIAGIVGAAARRHGELSSAIAEWHAGPTADGLEAMSPSSIPAGTDVPVLVTARRDGSIDHAASGPARTGIDQSVEVELRRGVGVTWAPRGATVEAPGADGRADLEWGPDEIIRLPEGFVLEADDELVVHPGTTVLVGPRRNLRLEGSVRILGTDSQPVWFHSLDERPWGGIVQSQVGRYRWAFFTNGGADDTQAFGHSASQPVLLVADGATLTLDHVVIADSPGKAIGTDGGAITIRDSVITRTDTGAELLDAFFTIERSWFIDFPSGERPAGDDDNDAIYLGPTSTPSRIVDSVFAGGDDDGIDHAGADVELRGLWIEGFANECLATSEAGTVLVTDTALVDCGQGIELGYGIPTVRAEHVLLLDNTTGIRLGDEYPGPHEGTLTLASSIVADSASADLVDLVELTGEASDVQLTVEGSPFEPVELGADLRPVDATEATPGLLAGRPR